MLSFTHTITDPAGMHARPAGLLAKCTQKCSSTVNISLNGKTADAKRLFAVMGLGAKQNDVLSFTVTGENEVADCAAIEAFCKENL